MTHDYSLLTDRREAALPPKPFILISRTPLSCKKRKENREKQEDTISRFLRCFRFRGLSVSIRGQRKSVSTFRHGKTPKTQCFRRFLAPPARLERTTSRLGGGPSILVRYGGKREMELPQLRRRGGGPAGSAQVSSFFHRISVPSPSCWEQNCRPGWYTRPLPILF